MNDTRAFSKHLSELLRREHFAMADFLLALAEFDRERRWLELGYASCFEFLHRELGVSKGAAFYRRTAAELVQRYPEVIEPLRDGRLCISSIAELAKVITPENRGEIIPRFFHVSAREAKAISAEVRPVEVPPRREVVTPVRAAPLRQASEPPHSPPALDRTQLVQTSEPETRASSECRELERRPEPWPPSRPAAAGADVTVPLTATISRLHITVSRRFLDKLAAARDALSHTHAGASTEAVLEAALDLLLEKDAKRKGLVEKPRATPPPSQGRPRHIPAWVKRAVWLRDGGRCQWRLASGQVCGSTRRLQLDHVVPVARGGPSSIDNLRVLCATHNALAAREVFGDAIMDGFTHSASRHAPTGAPADRIADR